jgi:hypothetical protein
MHEPPHLRTGDLVHVRRQRWRVVDVRVYERCQLLALAGIEPGNRGLERRVLTPFDTVAANDREAALQFVRPQRWRRACRALLADDAPAAGLRAARSARIDLLPHQLEPALAILSGRGARVLLADDVGLGKTIQAGLIIAELRARGIAERVLIVTPAGLRDQWAEELSARFDITASIDFATCGAVATLPIGVNPGPACRSPSLVDFTNGRTCCGPPGRAGGTFWSTKRTAPPATAIARRRREPCGARRLGPADGNPSQWRCSRFHALPHRSARRPLRFQAHGAM